MAFPGTYNITYYQGDTYEFNIYPKRADGSVFSLSGYSVTFKISQTRGGSSSDSIPAMAQIDENNTFISCKILPSPNGPGDSLVPNTNYVYDVQVKKGTDYVYTLLTGTLSVTADVTEA